MKPWEHNVHLEADGSRLSLLWPLLAGVLAICLIALAAAAMRGSVSVVVARHSIQPFSRIKATDLKVSSVRAEGFQGSETSVHDLKGKLTTAGVASGERIEQADLLAVPAGGAGKLRFQVQPDHADALDLEPGETVRLWFSPTGKGGRGVGICALLLAVPDADSPSEQTYVVAVGRKQGQVLVTHLGRSRLLLSRPG
ncbi:MAG: SAF domain-containing protein [Solirubrobacterales bacterium]